MPMIPPSVTSDDYLSASKRACPQCGLVLDRIRRRPLDRLTSFFAPVQRYHCRSFTCRWEGNVKTDQKDVVTSSLL